MSDYTEVRHQFELMWGGLAEMPWAVPTLREFLDDDGDLTSVPNLDRLARGILLPHAFETPLARLGLIDQLWSEYEDDGPHSGTAIEVDTDDVGQQDMQRRILWTSEGLLYDDLAVRFGTALPPAVRAHIDQKIAEYRLQFAWEAKQS